MNPESTGSCRLCGQHDLGGQRHLPCPKKNFARDIELALGVDVTHDTQRHPQYICQSCKRKLEKWRKNANQHKKTKININVVPDDGFSVDAVEPFWTEIQKICPEYGFIQLPKSTDSGTYCLFMSEDTVRYSVDIEDDRSWKLNVCGLNLAQSHQIHREIGEILTLESVHQLLAILADSEVCQGNPDFGDVASGDERCVGTSFRSDKCMLVISSSERNRRCTICTIMRGDLARRRSRSKEVKMSREKKLKFRLSESTNKVRQLKRKVGSLEEQMVALKDAVAKNCDNDGLEIEDDFSKEFASVMRRHKSTGMENSDPESAQFLLWQQQMKAISSTNMKGMRWHPALLRWCISLHAKSPAAYRMIKKSKFLVLPHETTLRDYTHFTTIGSGFNLDVINRLRAEYAFDSLHEFQRCVTVSFDEVKIKEGLVYSTETGQLIGFCDLGTVNNELHSFAKHCESGKTDKALATHMLTIMIRGIFSNLEVVIGHFPCTGFTSDQLYYVVWQAVGIMEACGLSVRAITSDGASPNRKFYRLHGNCADPQQPVNSVINPYDRSRKIFFFCDVPHLMKTARNNWENSGWNKKSRNLHYNHQDIKWPQLVTLVEEDMSRGGLRLLPKVNFEHIHLSPSLRMKVKLAAQVGVTVLDEHRVFSTTTAKAFENQDRHDTRSTQHFIKMMDTFFDCLNVSTAFAGKNKRKIALEPYESVFDWRFEWLENDFLVFLKSWEDSCLAIPTADLPLEQKRKMCLSIQTLEGLRITVGSFITLAKELLVIPGVKYLLSEKFSQDPLEQYFSKQRGMGGRCDNPTVQQFQQNALTLQVARSPAVLASTRGNCQRQGGAAPVLDATTISRRQHLRH